LYRTQGAYGATYATNRAGLADVGRGTYGNLAADCSYLTGLLTKKLSQFSR